ncbi:MAG: hypothetical protein ACKVXR_05860 [Planctomycetota bacterium]
MKVLPLVLSVLALPCLARPPLAQEPPPLPDEIAAKIEEVRRESDAKYQDLLEEIDAWKRSSPAGASWTDRLALGGYGEIHYNSENVDGAEQIDIHRFVGYVGYRFEDWIQLHSELELEHALVEDGNGELSMEQLHVDFLLRPSFNVRAGRYLTPLGIVNETHEPTTFNGVERPDFDTYILPTTWSSDGVGIFGDLSEDLKYQLYLGSSLDGSAFDPVDGIRGGRQKERPGLSEPALSGRLDWYPGCVEGELRLGVSVFAGGLDNGNRGNDPGIDADLRIYSADGQYSLGRWDFRGAYAFERIGGAADIGGGVASQIDGYTVEAARHILPETWRKGRLANADLITFLRYDALDTQKEMPSGVAPDPAGERDIITFGFGFLPTPGLVIKTDFQIRDDEASGLPERFNIGLGWHF